MDIKEIDQVSLTEERFHWWIRTRYNYIDKALSFISKDKLRIAEFGCGSCQNLWYLRNKSQKIHSLVGIDPEMPEDIEFDWMTSEDRIERDLNAKIESPDLLLGMDVLEHIEDDFSALDSWVKHMGKDSIILLTVPAFQSLWSYHDEFLDHKRRYTKEDLLSLSNRCGLEPIFLNYAFGPLFPVVWIVRKIIGRNDSQKDSSSDLKQPFWIINNALRLLGWLEAKVGGTPFFGTSVIGIFKLKE